MRSKLTIFTSLFAVGLASAMALGAVDQTPDYEAIRQRLLSRVRADLLAEGLTEDEATAEVERLDREAVEMAGSDGAGWSWAMDQALRYRRTRLLLARGDEAVADGKAAVEAARAAREAREKARTLGLGDDLIDPAVYVGCDYTSAASPAAIKAKPSTRTTMIEVNRRRREAGELGTKRQRKARKGRR